MGIIRFNSSEIILDVTDEAEKGPRTEAALLTTILPSPSQPLKEYKKDRKRPRKH